MSAMFLFKTSGATFASVIRNQKHAFRGKPAKWDRDEMVLVSKNWADCRPGERQIQYVMRIVRIRPLRSGEAELYWPGNEGRWKYLVECDRTKTLRRPFNLAHALGPDEGKYRPIMTFGRLGLDDERRVVAFVRQNDAAALE